MENENINNNKIENLIKELEDAFLQYENNDLCIRCDGPKSQHCCNVMVEHKIHLNPPAFCDSKINSKIQIEVKIEKACAGAIIISGSFFLP